MTYYGSKEIADSFRTVRKNTIVAAEDIPEEQYGFRATPETRTVAQTLVHIAVLPRLPEQIHFIERRTTLEGFDFFAVIGGLMAEEQVARSKAEIIAMLRDGGEKFAKLLDSCDESFLGERVSYPPGMVPPSKSRFEMLISAKEHEMHHRAQLMVMERLVGVVPHLTRQMQERIAAMKASQANA
jgi:uncharacterized damage-inducible protein DinB